MGFDPSAELVWGIPVESCDDEGEPTKFWNEDDDDWSMEIYDDDELTLVFHGYHDGEPQAILTSRRVQTLSAYAGETTEVSLPIVSDKVPSKANDRARALGLDVDFYGEAKWWLVASYG
jgi:hypothetical protein